MILINKYKYIFLSLLIIIIFIVIYRYSHSKINDKNSIKKIKIGLSIDSFVVERWQTDKDVFMAKAKELGADIIVQNAGNNSDEQISQIKYLIDEGVDVLVILPNDSDALSNVIAIAKQKGIKVIAYDRLIRKSNVDLYITFDNTKVGELMASAISKKVSKGNYIIINGNPKDYNSVQFNQGFYNILNEFLKSGDIKIVKEVWAKGWRDEDAYNCVEEVIASGVKIDGIIAANDSLADAAIQALSEHRLAGTVAVVGEDAALIGCQRVVEGLQLMTVYKPIIKLAQAAAESAVKLAKGEEVNANGKIYDGLKEIPVLTEATTAVTKENMIEVVVKNNFHRMEDIYRNIPQGSIQK